MKLNLDFLAVIIIVFMLILLKACGSFTFNGHLVVLVAKRDYANKKQKQQRRWLISLLTKPLKKGKALLKTVTSSTRP